MMNCPCNSRTPYNTLLTRKFEADSDMPTALHGYMFHGIDGDAIVSGIFAS